jgi:hypothetical protein
MLQILITIDTEIGELGKYRPNAFETFIEGKVDDKEVGYRSIMDILDKYNAKGEFFVDIYPYKQIGEDKFALLCQNITKRGHNVQLHTHPSMAFDKNRIYMHQYSLKEQIEILGLGKRKIKEWISKYPVAHRAGGYGINEDTFRALENIGIYYDSSYFYGNDNCKVYYDIKNVPFKVGNITEIPITVFKRITNRSFFSINIYQREYFQKHDIRYGATEDEIKELISKSDNDINIILFFHSFNFLKLPYNFRTKRYGKISINKKMMEKFENIIKWISLQNNCSFTTIDKLKINFSQKETYMEIFKKESIYKIIYDKFANRILRIRKT